MTRKSFLLAMAGLCAVLVPRPTSSHPVVVVSDSTRWRADHHMHLASVDLCERVGECLPSEPPAVLGSDAVKALDDGQVDRGVILSCAYLYGLASLHLKPSDVALWTRRENEFVAEEVTKFSSRLVGFLSVDPLQPSAISEIEHWRGSTVLVGLKLHFTASAVSVRRALDRQKVARVFRQAALQGLPIAVHVGGGKFNGADAENFIRTMLPSAGQSWVQIAHAGGGLPFERDNHVAVLRAFADHIVRGDSVTRRVLFDLSYVPAPEENDATVAALVTQMRRIGLDRFLFASDFNVSTPVEQAKWLARLKLTPEEEQQIRKNCAPWVCR